MTDRCASGKMHAQLLRWFATILLAFSLVAPAQAHPVPFSYLDVHLRDGQVDGTLVFHMTDLAHDLHMEDPTPLLESEEVDGRRDAIVALIGPRLKLRTDRPLKLEWTDMTPIPDKQQIRMDFRAESGKLSALTLDAVMFPYDPRHQTFVNVYEGDALHQQWILGKDSHERTYYTGTTAGMVSVMKTFIPSGIHHILIGPDHIAFLIGLLLLGGSWKKLLTIVTAFTLGHSVTLSLAALNIVTPPASLIEPAIALTIIVVGVDNLLRGSGRDLRAFEALFFGLIHGFGFANVLREFGLPREALVTSLFSFNVGVELGQLVIVLIVASLVDFIWRRSPKLGNRVAIAGSIAVIAAGSYWFVERVFFPGGIL